MMPSTVSLVSIEHATGFSTSGIFVSAPVEEWVAVITISGILVHLLLLLVVEGVHGSPVHPAVLHWQVVQLGGMFLEDK